MRRLVFVLTSLFCLLFQAQAQDQDPVIAQVAGVGDISELNEDEYDRLSHFLTNPIQINSASEARLLSSGLFTAFQVVSIIDYRKSSGDILSANELAHLDGFTEDRVKDLKPFLNFSGTVSNTKNQFHAEGVWRTVPEGPHKIKVKVRYGDLASVSWSPVGTFYVSVAGQKRPWQVVVGDFKAKFGQGLAVWDGLSITSITSVNSLIKTNAGVSPAYTWSEGYSRKGIAATGRIGRWAGTAFISGTGLWGVEKPISVGTHLTFLTKEGQLSATYFWKTITPAIGKKAAQNGEAKVALDFLQGIGPVELFGEAAWDFVPQQLAAIGGVRTRGTRLNLILQGRYYPTAYLASAGGAFRAGSKVSDEAGIALGGEYRSRKWVQLAGITGFSSSVPKWKVSTILDFSKKQFLNPQYQARINSQVDFQANSYWKFQFRFQEKLRHNYSTPPHREDFRFDTVWSNGHLSSDTRLNLVYSEQVSFLTYQELGYKDTFWKIYFRGTIFFADKWNDRIYCYERDAPGGFNVPAFYGRGWKLSLLAGHQVYLFHTKIAMYLRASYLDYSWMQSPKPSKFDMRFQLNLQY